MPESQAASRASSPRPGAGSPRSPRMTHTGHSAARTELAQLRARLEWSEQNQARLQAALQQRERQCQSAEVAAHWATGQLGTLQETLDEAIRYLGELQAAPGGSGARRGTPSRARRFESASTAGSDRTQRAMGDLCSAVNAAAARAREVRERVGALDGDRQIRQLQTQVRHLERLREQQGSELRRLSDENRQLVLTGNAAPQQPPLQAAEEVGGVTVLPPQVVRVPSLTHHGVNSDHWPVRSVGTQTPRLTPEGDTWASACGSPAASRAASPLRAGARHSYGSVPTPGSAPRPQANGHALPAPGTPPSPQRSSPSPNQQRHGTSPQRRPPTPQSAGARRPLMG
eukprot:TRINITY_DN1859_c0_g2_i2.p1 TRINITY_DN1859_c0_g2~~TRINITY_DN1859_c0_g2_i2.p1  ORF type:complete len:381 (+),score=102.68 TRINITY_DN1859_c0_g2_i2:117-1145(+)